MLGKIFVNIVMNRKGVLQTWPIVGAAVLFLVTALICPPTNADWLTAEALQEAGYEEFSLAPDEWSRLHTAFEMGMYVRSERLSSGPFSMYERRQTAMGEGAGALELPEYFQVIALDDMGYEPTFAVAVTPEHYARVKQEMDPNRIDPLTMADALEMYADGLIVVSAVVDQGIAGSDFAHAGANPDLRSVLNLEDDPDEDEDYYKPRKDDQYLDVACDHMVPFQDAGKEAESYENSDSRADNYEFSRLGGAQLGVFSAKLFFFGPACMLRAVSDRMETYEGDDVEGEAFRMMQSMDLGLLELAELMSTVNVGSIPVSTWAIPNIDMKQVGADGTKTTINKIFISMDMENFVIVKNRSEGTIEADGQTREFYLESEMSDFRYVADTVLFEPYRKVFRMGGMLDPEQRAQMQEAKAKLAEFDQQMASMPPSQRSMMEKMMGSKLEQFRKLADDGTFEMEMITTEFVINPHLKATNTSAALPFSQSNIVKIVQGHLGTLGYDPGNTTGELTEQTILSITKFEAANDMPVTGKATVELVAALEASISAQQ